MLFIKRQDSIFKSLTNPTNHQALFSLRSYVNTSFDRSGSTLFVLAYASRFVRYRVNRNFAMYNLHKSSMSRENSQTVEPKQDSLENLGGKLKYEV